jgi:hypothetical protein
MSETFSGRKTNINPYLLTVTVTLWWPVETLEVFSYFWRNRQKTFYQNLVNFVKVSGSMWNNIEVTSLIPGKGDYSDRKIMSFFLMYQGWKYYWCWFQCYKTLLPIVFTNRSARIRHKCRKTTVLSCHRCLINPGIEKMNNI